MNHFPANQDGCHIAAGLRELGETCEIVVLHSVRESDWDQIRAFVRRMDRGDLRSRFGMTTDFDDEMALRRLFGIGSHEGEVARITDGSSSITGISHRARISTTEAEIALIVRSDFKGRGIGRRLLNCLICRSTRQRLKKVSGLVYGNNWPMIRLAGSVGFVPREFHGSSVELEFTLADLSVPVR